MIDQPGSIAQLALAVAARRQVPVAYIPGLVMRRAADLYPGEAKTSKRDAFIITDTGRIRRRSTGLMPALLPVFWSRLQADILAALLLDPCRPRDSSGTARDPRAITDTQLPICASCACCRARQRTMSTCARISG